jgi:hypothetical protein
MVSDEAADLLEATVDALTHEWSSSTDGSYWEYSTAVPRP